MQESAKRRVIKDVTLDLDAFVHQTQVGGANVCRAGMSDLFCKGVKGVGAGFHSNQTGATADLSRLIS